MARDLLVKIRFGPHFKEFSRPFSKINSKSWPSAPHTGKSSSYARGALPDGRYGAKCLNN